MIQQESCGFLTFGAVKAQDCESYGSNNVAIAVLDLSLVFIPSPSLRVVELCSILSALLRKPP